MTTLEGRRSMTTPDPASTGTARRAELARLAAAAKDRVGFLHQRSVEISAFEAQTEEEAERLWTDALANADALWSEATDAKVREAFTTGVPALLADIERLERIRKGLERIAAHHILGRDRAHGNSDPECPICQGIAPLIAVVAEEDRAYLAALDSGEKP